MADYFDSVQSQLSGLCARSAHRQRRSPRLPRPGLSTVMLLASAAVTVAIAVLALGLLSAGRHPANQAPGGQRPGGAMARPAMLRGIPQSGRVLGNPGAPVQITYVADLECPICRRFTLGDAFRELVRSDVRSGRVKLYFRSLCTVTCAVPGETNSSTGKPSTFATQQAAAYAAGRQDRLWDYALVFFKHQGPEATPYVTASYLKRLASRVQGLNLSRWQAERKRPETLAEVKTDAKYAQAHRIEATPTLVVTGPRGAVTLVGSETSYQQLAHAIARVQERPSTTTRLSAQLQLEGSGIAQAHFGAPERMVVAMLTQRFGAPEIPRAGMGACTGIGWTGLQLGSNGQSSTPVELPVQLRVYFKQSAFFGYSYYETARSQLGRNQHRWLMLATVRGLSVGTTAARARGLYGRAFAVSGAVAGAGVPWTVTTPSGRITGMITMPTPHFHQIIQAINAPPPFQGSCP